MLRDVKASDMLLILQLGSIFKLETQDFAAICRWTKGHVALLGDSAHAMQPNLGQGGCMAIEDGYQLAMDLNDAIANAKDGYPDIPGVLQVHCIN